MKGVESECLIQNLIHIYICIFWDQHWGMSRSSYAQTITQLLCSWSQEQTRKVRREGFAAGGCSQEMTTAAATTATTIITTQKQKKQRWDSKTIAWFSSFPYYMILQVAFGNQIVWSQAGKANLEMNMHGFSQHLIPFMSFQWFLLSIQKIISPVYWNLVVWDEMLVSHRHWTSRGVAVTNKLDELEGRPRNALGELFNLGSERSRELPSYSMNISCSFIF